MAATEIWSNWPCLPVIRCASGSVNSAIVAPPNESTSPSVAMPTTVYSCEVSLAAIRTESPISKPSSSAVALSIAISSSAVGLPPST